MTMTTDRPALYTDTPDLERRVRSMDPDTSWEAAAIDPASLSGLKANILAILTDRGPLTDDDIYEEFRTRVQDRAEGYLPKSATRVRTARHELTVLTNPPQIRLESEDGRSALNRRAQVWAVIPESARRGHVYEKAIEPDKHLHEHVCRVCGEFPCPVIDACGEAL